MFKPGSACFRTIFYGLTPVLFFFIFCAETKSEEIIDVSNAWIRAAPGGATMFAGYFTITNSATKPDATSPGLGANTPRAIILSSVTSPYFKKITIHRSVVRNGMAEMVQVKKFTIQTGQTQIFEPGGFHLMLMQPTVKVKTGKFFPIKMKFQSGKEVTVIFKVRRH